MDGQGWTEAAELAAGQSVRGAGGQLLLVITNSNFQPTGGVVVYNFEVEGDHTYFVADGSGDESWAWVHNRCNPLRPALEKAGVWGKIGDQAAHVVPVGRFSGRSDAVQLAVSQAQAVLKHHGIGLNSHWNGLRAGAGHLGTHSNKFLLHMSKRLWDTHMSGGSRAEVLSCAPIMSPVETLDFRS